jgi:glycosyltransferase involved in cell wall biosynthesis
LVGEVPDVRPLLGQAQVVIVPLRVARGLQNKVLEAMAMAKAVVASPAATEGLDVASGVHLLEACSETAWADAVFNLLTDAGQRRRLGSAGRRFVEKHFRWEAQYQRLAQLPVLADLLQPPSTNSCTTPAPV